MLVVLCTSLTCHIHLHSNFKIQVTNIESLEKQVKFMFFSDHHEYPQDNLIQDNNFLHHQILTLNKLNKHMRTHE